MIFYFNIISIKLYSLLIFDVAILNALNFSARFRGVITGKHGVANLSPKRDT